MGSATRTLPIQAFAESRGETRRALMRLGSGAVPVFAPTLTVGEFKLFVAAM
jgi:hypothetical protein